MKYSGRTAAQKPLRQAQDRPNVLFIAIDDLNDWVGHLGGHSQVKTPYIDRLAERGVFFANAHCPAPICVPSRTSLLTGWTNMNDTIEWDMDVITAGTYEVAIQYTCPPEAVGTKLRVEADGTRIEGSLIRAHNPEPRLRPTRHRKKRYIQTFATQPLGEIELKQGRQRIRIRALNQPADTICDVKLLSLKLKE